MTLHTIDWALLGAYLIYMLYLSLKPRKEEMDSMESFLLIGRRLTLPSFIATTVSTWYGGILGVGEYSYKYGISNWLVFGIPYYLGAFIFAMLLSGRANKARLMTIPDQIEATYGTKLGIGSAIYVFMMIVPAAYVLMFGIMLKLLFGWSLLTGVVVGTIVSTFYVFLGGFKADVRSDRLNFILMFSSFATILFLLVNRFGGLDYIVSHVPVESLQWHGGNSAGYIFSWYFIALSALIEPSFYQRAYAAESPKVARAGILLSIPFWILFDFMTTSVGLYSRAVLGPDIPGADAFPLLADKILPFGFKAIMLIGMLATIQSTVDSYTVLTASTLSHDILYKSKLVVNWIKEVWLTRIALIVSGILATTIAMLSGSVIDIWNRIGSLGTPGLMLPLALSYFPRLAYRKFWAGLTMILAPVVVGGWFIVRDRSVEPSFPFSVEPIYVGIGLALAILALDHGSRRIFGLPSRKPESSTDKTL